MVANNVVPLPLAVSGALPGATAYNAADSYWLPAPSAAPPNNPNYAVIKGFIKIEAQTAPYPMTCIAAKQYLADDAGGQYQCGSRKSLALLPRRCEDRQRQ